MANKKIAAESRVQKSTNERRDLEKTAALLQY
jgi:hypothetical protein